MDYAKPADVVDSMIDVSLKKLALAPRDLLIRGALYARSLSGRTGKGIHAAALYGAFAVIAAVVFGTLSVHPF